MNVTTMQTTSYKSSTITTTTAAAATTETATIEAFSSNNRQTNKVEAKKIYCKYQQQEQQQQYIPYTTTTTTTDHKSTIAATTKATTATILKPITTTTTTSSTTATPTTKTPSNSNKLTSKYNYNSNKNNPNHNNNNKNKNENNNISSENCNSNTSSRITNNNNCSSSNCNGSNVKSATTTKTTTIRIGILCIILQLNLYFHHITATSLMHINDYLNTERPYFDDVSARNVSAVTDERIILKCRVKNKGNRTVSWMRKRDLHILTTNIYTYTGDQRFSVIHTPGSDDWDLKIDYAQQRDSGIYECQVNTEPKINLAIVLEVHAASDVKSKSADPPYYDAKAARAKILGSTEIHVKRDSTIALACSVNIHASSVAWYHGAAIVDFDSLRGGISLETEKTDIGTTSRLMLTRATFRDSGNYTCVPNGAIPASVRVHVLTGEQPAAMQTSNAAISIWPKRMQIQQMTLRNNWIITATTTIAMQHLLELLCCVGALILWQLIIISQSTATVTVTAAKTKTTTKFTTTTEIIQAAVDCMKLQQKQQQHKKKKTEIKTKTEIEIESGTEEQKLMSENENVNGYEDKKKQQECQKQLISICRSTGNSMQNVTIQQQQQSEHYHKWQQQQQQQEQNQQRELVDQQQYHLIVMR